MLQLEKRRAQGGDQETQGDVGGEGGEGGKVFVALLWTHHCISWTVDQDMIVVGLNEWVRQLVGPIP